MLEYHPRNHYVNDFTIIEKSGLFHLFHITGPRRKMSTGLQDMPYQGHAVSRDLIHWTEKPFATELGGACNAVKHRGKFALVENVNRVSWSRDLYQWSAPEPIHLDFGKHAKVYETSFNKPEARYASHRDPFIWRDKESRRYVMFFCSRTPHGDMFTRGCVGAAVSADLINWELQPPVYGPGDHLFCESPHVVDLDGKYHLFFTLSPENGLRHAASKNVLGPYEEVERRDLLPAYFGASEAIKAKGRWKFFGRIEDRNERANSGRLAPRALALPLNIAARADDSIAFSAIPELGKMRGPCLFSTRKQGLQNRWQVESGDWRVNKSHGLAPNEHEAIPPNSLYGAGNIAPARVFFDEPVRHIDIEFDIQLPSFNGNDVQARAGCILDGVCFALDSLLKSLVVQDHRKDLIACQPLPLYKKDRYYHVRLFRRDDVVQAYVDGELAMYLPVYGDGRLRVGFFVDHSDTIVKDVRIWRLKVPGQGGFCQDDPKGRVMNGTTMP